MDHAAGIKRAAVAATATMTALLALAPAARGQNAEPDRQGPGAPHAEIVDLGFMSGCWHGTFESKDGPGTIEEHYTDPAANLMLGTSRYLVKGAATQFEFTAIQKQGDDVLLIPYPGGARSEDAFRLTEAGAGRAVFEAPEHDYPKRIVYRREEDGSLTARIDGGTGDPHGEEWRMRPGACAGGS